MPMSSSSTTKPINAEEFLTHFRPALFDGDMRQALQCVRGRWTTPQIAMLLSDSSADVRKVAALALSLAGDQASIKPLAVALHDRDPMVTQVAEHALWSIWFRLGKPRAVRYVQCGSQHLQHNNFCCAIQRFSQAIDEDPKFAEAHNQRAIAYYLGERFEKGIEDCKATLALIPQHFGAMAGMGHCHAHMAQWNEARHCYRLALAIHPRLEGIQASLNQITRLLKENPKK